MKIKNPASGDAGEIAMKKRAL